MGHLIAFGLSLAVIIGFVVLTRYERRRGSRVCAATRAWLDTQADRAAFIIAHVDLAAFAKEEVNLAFTRIGHAVANLSLQTVRAAERLLTRAVRHFRVKGAENAAPRENAREFVKTLSDFKETLSATHPEISDVE